MKPQLIRWSPTTCGCEIIEYKDENGDIKPVTLQEAQTLHRQIFQNYPNDTVDPDTNPQRPLNHCAAHVEIGDAKEIYATMMQEGKIMCGVHRILLGLESIKDLDLHEEKKVKGSTEMISDFKENIEYKWHFEGSGKTRKLIARVVGTNLTKSQKDAIKSLCDQKHGAGRVDIL
jgi:hypothetical protein